MTITAAIVLFAVIWFMILYILLPQKITSQSEAEDVVPGTPGSAPIDPMLKRKLVWTTAATLVLWAAVVAVIMSGWISIDDIQIFDTGF